MQTEVLFVVKSVPSIFRCILVAAFRRIDSGRNRSSDFRWQQLRLLRHVFSQYAAPSFTGPASRHAMVVFNIAARASYSTTRSLPIQSCTGFAMA